MIVAGEASGDAHAAGVVNALKRKNPKISFFGIGGKAMAVAGVEICVNFRTLSVVGITEVFSKLPNLFAAMGTAKRLLKARRPSLLIVIDFPDFNIYLAKTAKRHGIPVLYYISPQIWAWRQGRVKKIKAVVDHMAVILPFEASFYRKHGVPVTFVGHPLLDTDATSSSCNDEKDPSCIGLLPGSRDREIVQNLPVMLNTAEILQKKHPNIKFLLSVATGLEVEFIQKYLQGYEDIINIQLMVGNVHSVLEQSVIVLAVSGTVTLEAALSGTPMAVMYKLSPLSCYLGKTFVKLNCFSLVNLISGRPLVPEFLQDDANPENLANTLDGMLSNPEKLEKNRRELLKLRKRLGGPGAGTRVADIAIRLMSNR
jgi:lipid-A-disaccharide synthase